MDTEVVDLDADDDLLDRYATYDRWADRDRADVRRALDAVRRSPLPS